MDPNYGMRVEKPEKYILSKVSILSMETVPQRFKSNLEFEESDFILTPLHSRNSSKIIDKELASLMDEFKTPKTFAEAIFHYSESRNIDPLEIADQAFIQLHQFRNAGFLIPYTGSVESGIFPVFKLGDHFRSYTLIKKLQSFEDSDVYKIENDKGEPFALKILFLKKSNSAKILFQNEVEILKALDGKINPKCIEAGIEEEYGYLIIEWKTGVSAKTESEKFRNYHLRSHVISLLTLCIHILEAYEYLHGQGIIHGDIHSGNVLINEKLDIQLIDFGYSARIESKKRISRAGVAHHYEPEYAITALNKKPSPILTLKGEQYSLASLLYYILTGQHYINFSLEREKLFEQILHEPPIPIASLHLNLPKDLDPIFSRALAKDPDHRFQDLKEFKQAFIQVKNQVFDDPSYFIHDKSNSEKLFPEFLKRKYGWHSKFLENGLTPPPHSSINLGSGGISYFFYRMALLEKDFDLLNLADIWIHHALNFETDYKSAFYDPENQITEETIGKRSLYHSPTGLFILKALIEQKKGDREGLDFAIKKFIQYADVPDSKLDLTLGKAGLLLGASLLTREIGVLGISASYPEFISFINRIQDEIWHELGTYPQIMESNPVDYHGMAHGWAGILYSSLLWCQTTNQDLPIPFPIRILELESIAISDGDGIYWPFSHDKKYPWPGWCHGSAGHSFLWSLMYNHTRDKKYLRLAEKSLHSLLSKKLLANGNLCCGLAGQAYAFLNLYKLNKDKSYLEIARKLQGNLMQSLNLPVLRRHSLYRGEIGMGLLIAEMENPLMARMPFFE